MRVTILGRDFPPTIGGIADHTDHLSAELARRGTLVTVVCAAPADERASYAVRAVVQRWDAAGIPAIMHAVRESAPDAIIWQYNPFNIGRRGIGVRAAARLAKALRKEARLIVLAHELWFPWGRGGPRGLVWAIAQRIQTRGVLRRAHAIVVTTPAREALLKRRYGGKVMRIGVGTNIEPRPAEHDMRAMLGIARDAFLIAHLGTAGPGKDLAPAFSALKGMRDKGIDAHLVLAGKGVDATAFGDLTDAVHVTGVLTRAEISALLQAADCYLHPDHAGASIGRRGSLVAAIAHATPVVSYRGPDGDPALVDGENVVLVAPDASELAAALEHLQRDPDFARRIGRSGRISFDRYFSWTRIGDALMGVLQSRS